MAGDGVLFVPYQATLDLLSVEDAMRICEDVYRMHARGAVQMAEPPSFRLDVAAPFNNHSHVKGVFLADIPTSGIRLYNYYDDGTRNTVGALDCTRFIVLSDPRTGRPLAIVDEHWSYAVRSTAAAVVPCKWLGPPAPKALALVGVGTMANNALRCLLTLYRFEEIRCASRRRETREEFARTWAAELGIPVMPVDSARLAVEGADIVVGCTTSTEAVSRAAWLKPGATFISMARWELDPADWLAMDKVVINGWDVNMRSRWFRAAHDKGLISRDRLHGEIADVVTGRVPGREGDAERILILTDGLVSQDVAIAHFIYEKAQARGVGIRLPGADRRREK
jgi:ornithine cyclodeaminase